MRHVAAGPALAALLLFSLGAPALGAGAHAAAKAGSPPPPAAAATPVKITAEERAEARRMDPLAQASFWDRVAQAEPRDLQAKISLAAALRALGRYDQADASVSEALVIDPRNLDALLEQARDRIAAGRGFYAIEPATRAEQIAPADWRCPSLLAIALEQDQRDKEALAAHQRALALAPNNPAAMSNLAMFEAAHGQPAAAEALLRRAVAEPGATARVRQNLALLLGLDGRYAEAEALERLDLPPGEVENDLAYFRAAQGGGGQRSWASVEAAH